MRQDAGLRLKCLGGRLAWGRWPISLVYGATEWSCYGLRDVFKYFLINPAYTTISSSIKLLLTRTIGPSCYFINSRLLKQELFSAINKSIRLWPCGPIRLRDFSTRLCLLDVMVWDPGKCRSAKCNAAIGIIIYYNRRFYECGPLIS